MNDFNRILTDAQRALLGDVGEADLPPRLPEPFRLVAPASHCLLPGNRRYHKEAKPGTFLGLVEGVPTVLPKLTGIIAGVENTFIERTSDFGFIAEYARRPPDAVWLRADEASDGKAGLALPNGHRVHELIVLFLVLLNPELKAPSPGIFSFTKGNLAAARDLVDRASRLRDDELGVKGCVLGLIEISATLASGTFGPYWAPVPRLIGKLGESLGPTLDQVLLAAAVRKGFKAGEAWPLAIAAVGAEVPGQRPALAAAQASEPRPQPRAQITSGRLKLDDGPPAPPVLEEPENDPNDPGWQPGEGEVADDDQDHFPI
jgi:hypothetical protein